jgi:hypothetical protein
VESVNYNKFLEKKRKNGCLSSCKEGLDIIAEYKNRRIRLYSAPFSDCPISFSPEGRNASHGPPSKSGDDRASRIF